MIVQHKLGREATFYKKGKYIKDLRYLNRNINKVVMLDVDPTNSENTPENVVIIPQFTGDTNDKELLQTIQFLKDLSKHEVKDVRKEIQKYGNFKPHINYYKSIPKYKKLLPRENSV